MLQQYLDFNSNVRAIKTGGVSGMRRRSAAVQPFFASAKNTAFIDYSRLASPATTRIFRVSEGNPDDPAHIIGLVLVDRTANGAEIIADAMYAIINSAGCVVLASAQSLAASSGQGTLLGRVVTYLPGAKSLRYVSNICLFQGQRQRCQRAVIKA